MSCRITRACTVNTRNLGGWRIVIHKSIATMQSSLMTTAVHGSSSIGHTRSRQPPLSFGVNATPSQAWTGNEKYDVAIQCLFRSGIELRPDPPNSSPRASRRSTLGGSTLLLDYGSNHFVNANGKLMPVDLWYPSVEVY